MLVILEEEGERRVDALKGGGEAFWLFEAASKSTFEGDLLNSALPLNSSLPQAPRLPACRPIFQAPSEALWT